ncbi:SGNH/GDSL hydrolase family protein [Streptomyces sp. NPDC060035]|uniref:SGNH/GDSL hydrolase family protein n=1 Tax=Streptomyces sp. NPDC060035 TaxID=3347044 RepID=UPI0036AB7E9F
MLSHREQLTPQMLQYAEKFDDRGEIRWLPYLMYFHAAGHVSDTVSTDHLGFRYSEGPDGQRASAGDLPADGPVRLMAGSSTVFGIGASADAHTLASRLWSKHAQATPWLNFGGRSFNSTQELLLFTLYRHLLPQVDEIVLLSGFNNLGLSRLPRWMQGDNGAFFNEHDYYEQVDAARERQRRAGAGRRLLARRASAPSPDLRDSTVPGLDEQLAHAVDLTVRHLDNWRLLAGGTGVKLTYVLQPLAPWVRERPAPQEQLLFGELDALANFSQAYGDICTIEAGRRYAAMLREGCARIGVDFLDLNPLLGEALAADEWAFVDRIHFTDSGHDTVAGLLADALDLH